MFLGLMENGVARLLENMQLMAEMFIVIMIASCFLGRQVVIKRKMVIASAGIVAVNLVVSILEIVYVLYNLSLMGGSNSEDLMKLHENVSHVFAVVIVAVIYMFAFVFYFLSFKEKRFLRAIESTICFYLYHLYSGVIVLFTYAYCNGGEYDLMYKITKEYGEEFVYYKNMQAVSLFCFDAVLVLWLYFGFFLR